MKHTRIILPERFKELFYKRCDAEQGPSKYPKKADNRQEVIQGFLKGELKQINKRLADRIKEDFGFDSIKRAFGGKTHPGCELPVAIAFGIFIEKKSLSLRDFCAKHDIPESEIALAQEGDNFQGPTIFDEAERVYLGNETRSLKSGLSSRVTVFDNLKTLSSLAIADANLVENVNWSKKRNVIHLHEVYAKRDIEDKIIASLYRDDKKKIIVVWGESGCGKTSLLWQLTDHFSNLSGWSAWLLKSSQIELINFDQILSSPSTPSSKRILFIDTLDLLLHTERDINVVTLTLQKILAAGFQIVVSTRPQEIHKLKKLNRIAKIEPHELGNFTGTHEVKEAIKNYAQVYYENEPSDVLEHIVEDTMTIVSNNYSLEDLCYVPLTLRMLFSVYAPHKLPNEINVFRLYQAFWKNKVEQDLRLGEREVLLMPDSKLDLSHVAAKLAIIMLSKGIPELQFRENETLFREVGIQTEELELLINRGVLKGNFKDTAISFFHQSFFEHSAAQALVKYGISKGLNAFESRLGFMEGERKVPLTHEFFILPVLEHFLLLAATSSASDRTEQFVVKLVESSNPIFKQSGLFVYVLYEARSERIDNAVSLLLTAFPRGEISLVKRFLKIAPSVIRNRLEIIINKLYVIWRRTIWNEQYNVICALEHFSAHSPQTVINFLKKTNCLDSVLKQHSKKGKARHSEIFRVLMRLYLKIARLDYTYACEETRRMIPYLEVIDLLYMLSLFSLNPPIGFESLHQQIILAIEKKCDEEMGLDRADILGYHWINQWQNEKLNDKFLSRIANEKKSFIQQTKVISLLKFIDAYGDAEALVLYSYFKDRLPLFKKIFWSRWLFTKLIDSNWCELPLLLKKFLNDLNHEVRALLTTRSYLSASDKQSIKFYLEAFFKSQNPNVLTFKSIDPELLYDLKLWHKYPPLVDIFVSALMAGDKVAIKYLKTLTNEHAFVDERIPKRLYANIINRKFYNGILMECLIRNLLMEADVDLFVEIVRRAFSKECLPEEQLIVKNVLLKHNMELQEYINKGIANKGKKESYGKLYFFCIENGLLPKPITSELFNQFTLKRGERNYIPALLDLLPVCSIGNLKELQQVLNSIKGAFEDPSLLQIAQVAYLKAIANCSFSIGDFDYDIIKIVFDNWCDLKNDDKVKWLGQIIIRQSELKNKLAGQLLYEFATNPIVAKELPAKRNGLFHDLWKAFNVCITKIKGGSRNRIINLLHDADIYLARPIVAAIFSNLEIYHTYRGLITELIDNPKVDADVRHRMQRSIRLHLLSQESYHWKEILGVFPAITGHP